MDITRRQFFRYAGAAAGAGIAVYALERSAANSKRVSAEVTKKLKVVNDPKADDEAIIKLSKSEFREVRDSLACRPYPLPREAQMNLSTDSSNDVLIGLSGRNDLLPETADNITKNAYMGISAAEILENIARQKNLQQETMSRIAGFDDIYGIWNAKIIIANRPDASVDTLEKIIRNSNYKEVIDAANSSLARRNLRK